MLLWNLHNTDPFKICVRAYNQQCARANKHGSSLQELANTLWAYASLGFTPSLDWLVQMGTACEEQVGGCKPQDLANLVWALATLQFHPGAPFLTAAMDTANRYVAASYITRHTHMYMFVSIHTVCFIFQ